MLSSAVICLALNIYFEARGESLLAQTAVAYATTNRLEEKGFSESQMCKLVWEKGQFSWTRHLKFYDKPADEEYVLSKQFMKGHKIRESYEWNESIELSKKVLKKEISNPIGKANNFHDLTVEPRWSRKFKFIKKIGVFKFYQEKQK
jgi:N-acetylmuramoyl-L-alanine amidase